MSFGLPEPRTFSPEIREQTLDLLRSGRLMDMSAGEVSKALNLSIKASTDPLQVLVTEGEIEASPSSKHKNRYVLTCFKHHMEDVRVDLFDGILGFFTGGRLETGRAVARHFGITDRHARATLEELRKQRKLQGRFLGALCLYRSSERGTVRQATEHELQRFQQSSEGTKEPAVD